MGTHWNKKKLDRVDDEHARCCVCTEVQLLKHFGDKDGYYATCHACRYKARAERMSNDLEYFFRDRLVTIRSRAAVYQVFCYLEVHHLMEIYERQQGKCFYTGVPLNLHRGTKKLPDGLSVDRIDNMGPYTSRNVVLCTNKANTVKSNLTMDEIREWLPGWYGRIEGHLRSLPAEEAFG